MQLSILDWIIAAALIAGLVLGYRRGFIRQLLSLTGWVIAYLAAFFLYDDVAPWIAKLVPYLASETTASPAGQETSSSLIDAGAYVGRALAFAILFFGCKLALSAAGWLLHGIASLPGLRMVNRTGGALLAFIETGVIAAIILLVMEALPSDRAQLWVADSTVFAWLKSHSPMLLDSLQSLWQRK